MIKHTATDIQIAWVECFNELVRLGYTLDYDRPAMERYVKKLVDSHYSVCTRSSHIYDRDWLNKFFAHSDIKTQYKTSNPYSTPMSK